MKFSGPIAVFSVVLAALVAIGFARSAEPGNLRLGMSMEEVRAVMGAPRQKNRQVILRRYMEQWQYDQVWVEFECVRGKEPFVVTIQSEK